MAPGKICFSTQKRAFAVCKYIETKSPKITRSLFATRFNIDPRNQREIPSPSAIRRWVKSFKTHGSVENKHRKSNSRPSHSGRPLSVRTPEKIKEVNDSVANDPKKSLQRRSLELGIKKTSLMRILTSDLKLRAYKIQFHQRLSNANAQDRIAACRWFVERCEQDASFLERIWFSDEAHFFLNGHVNKKNCIFWGSSKPDEVFETNVHDLKVTAWMAISSQGTIGPFFFMDEDKNTVTVTSKRYLEVLSSFWKALGRKIGTEARKTQWFQQDGAAPHTAQAVMEWIAAHFDEKVISRRTTYPWPSHSPDLNPLDYHVWGYLKDQMGGQRFASLQELRDTITAHAKNIPQVQCQAVVRNFLRRINMCISRDGKHVEHLL